MRSTLARFVSGAVGATAGVLALAGCTSSAKDVAAGSDTSTSTSASASGSAAPPVSAAPSEIAAPSGSASRPSASPTAASPTAAPYAVQYSTIGAPMTLALTSAQKLQFTANQTSQQLSAALLPLGMRLTAADSSLLNVAWPNAPTPVEADVKQLVAANAALLSQLGAATSVPSGGMNAYVVTLHHDLAASLALAQKVTGDLLPAAAPAPGSPSTSTQ